MKYFPTITPDDPQLSFEFMRLAEVINTNDELLFNEENVAQEKPRNGMVRYADGANWNPGKGRGLYQYQDGSWIPLNSTVHSAGGTGGSGSAGAGNQYIEIEVDGVIYKVLHDGIV